MQDRSVLVSALTRELARTTREEPFPLRLCRAFVRFADADGGAISLGHPLGSSGSRIAITLLGRMEREDAKIGLATMCIGVGQGTAMLLERV